MEIINHKLFKDSENTINGLRQAISRGYNKFEVDIRQIRNDVVLYHDDTYKGSYIYELCFNELKNIDKFDDFIQEINVYCSNLHIYFDIKGIIDIDLMINKIYKLNPKNKYYFQSFNIKTIYNLKQKIPLLKTGLILCGYNKLNIDKLKKIVNYLCIEEEYLPEYLNDDIVTHFDVYLWTVNISTKFEKYQQLGIKGIFTDYPKKFNICINK
jgi:glycerophosphoryl diester phosphodiesterase